METISAAEFRARSSAGTPRGRSKVRAGARARTGRKAAPARAKPASSSLAAAAMPEDAIHRAVVGHLSTRAVPGLVWWHTPNGEARSAVTGAKLKALGTKAGMPDLMALYQGHLYGLELKRVGGRLSAVQRARLEQLAAQGAHIAVARGLDAALVKLKGWGLLR